MPKRKGGRYKTILERMQEDPNVCNDWKGDESRGRKTIYTNKKECLDRIMMGSTKDTIIEARDRKRKEKKNKTKSKSRNRTRTRRR